MQMKYLCKRLQIKFQEKRSGTDTSIFDGEIVAKIDKISVYNIFLPNLITRIVKSISN